MPIPEEQEAAGPQVDPGEWPCFVPHDNPSPTRQCPVCKRFFCAECASPLDPEFCHVCMPVTEATVDEKPLVDPDGVTHEGTQKTPSGKAFKTSFAKIVEMTDEQLQMHIAGWQAAVKEAEQVLDYRRIRLSFAKHELGEREDSKYRRLKGVKVERSGQKITVSAGSASGSQDPKSAAMAKAMKAAGVQSGKDASDFMKMFAEFIKNKKAKVKP